MNENKKNTLLLAFSIVGFLSIIAGPVLFYFTEIYATLLVSLVGMIVSMYCATLSQKTPVRKRVNKVVVEDLLFVPKEPIKQASQDLNETIQISSSNGVDENGSGIIEETQSEKLSVHLSIDNTSAEALLRLVEKMEANDLVLHNDDFDSDNFSDKQIFKDKFMPVPVIGLVKNRHDNFNILAGLNNNDVETIGTIDPKDLAQVKAIYPSTQSIQALIYGGRYRSEENTLHNQTYRVFLTFYT